MLIISVKSRSLLLRELSLNSLSYLSESETQRLSIITTQNRRDEFLAGRWFMRKILCQRYGGSPVDWVLNAEFGQSPTLAFCRDVFLSLSHSGDWLACAVASVPVGIDVEIVKHDRPVLGMSRIVCHEKECAMLTGLENFELQRLFTLYWTKKEAWLKRAGNELDFSLMRRLYAVPSETKEGDVASWYSPIASLVMTVVCSGINEYIECSGLEGFRYEGHGYMQLDI